jgi:exodeoxyribonuclease V alpha subunit
MTTRSVPASPPVVPRELAAYVMAGVISADDVAAVSLLVEMGRRSGGCDPALLAWVAMCLALRTPRDGHTCVDLHRIDDWAAGIDLADADHLTWPGDVAAWKQALATAGPLVGLPGERTPFILDESPTGGCRLYLARSLHEEEEIARRLTGGAEARVRILLGGPGTGKTTQVAKRLIERFLAQPDTRIALAAPTGKAAARMAEALRGSLHDPRGPEELRHAPQILRDKVDAIRPVTIHKLLGNRPRGTPRYRYRADNPLTYDLVVVDETSMLSSSMMHHLLAALGGATELLLVGDPDQLASVDAGSVLADIAAVARQDGSPLQAATQILTVRHRFGPRIGALADAILAGDVHAALAVLGGGGQRSPGVEAGEGMQADAETAAIRWVEPHGAAFDAVMEEVVAHAGRLRGLAEAGDVAAALDAQKALQVLCAHREGRMGAAGWNAAVEKRLGVAGGSRWYAGRPVMVTRNNRAIDLFNGDVGIVVSGAAGSRGDAAFRQGGETRRIPISRLEDVSTVHALTIHKSQGSEYEHAIVVLPAVASRIATRELLYTGITRARTRVTVVGSREVIEAAISRPIRRASGLEGRLASRRQTS